MSLPLPSLSTLPIPPRIPSPFSFPFTKRNPSKEKSNYPVFPSLLAKPIKLIPQKIHNSAIINALNTLLAEPLQEGDLDFLIDQSVSIEVIDLNLKFALTLDDNGKLTASPWQEKDDLNLKGNLYEFLLLASRTEDSDTLFFQRRIKMEGSTDLGLEVKNLLDGLDMESVRYHQQIDYVLKKTVSIIGHFYQCDNPPL